MMKKILVLFLLASVTLSAQRTSSSPYSFFGVGDEFSAATVEQSSMGGIGVAFSHYKYLNFTNPAAYSDLRYTTYSFGVLNNDLTIKGDGEKQSSTSTSLSYLALAFPIGKKVGMSFGLQPFSSVGYGLTNALLDDVDGSEIDRTIFSGNGGINKLYGAFGIRVFKEFSVGIEAGYRFGNIENKITNTRLNVDRVTIYDEGSTIRGGSLTLGAQYKKELKNKLILDAGATFKMKNNLKVRGTDSLYTAGFNGVPRVVNSANTISGNYKLPLKTILGVGLGKFDKWYVGLEYETQNAIETSNFGNNTSAAFKYGSSNRFSLGGFYLPKINSISSYWQRVTYRAGVRFETTGLLVDGTGSNTNFTNINDFGISFGLGLPLKRLSTVNMGFEFGKRGTNTENLIQENYFNFRLSLSLTDTKWFQKRKID